MLEPVQGEGGFIPMTPDFPKRLQELLDHYGILYVNDEVQSGCGRTGPVWAIEHYDVEPDLLVAGKTLGGGLPLAAVTGRAELMDAVPAGGLGGTFGGNPLSCAAAVAILDALAEQRPRAEQLGERLRERLEAMAPAGSEVRGHRPDARDRAARADRRRDDTRSPPPRASRACCCSPAASTAT